MTSRLDALRDDCVYPCSGDPFSFFHAGCCRQQHNTCVMKRGDFCGCGQPEMKADDMRTFLQKHLQQSVVIVKACKAMPEGRWRLSTETFELWFEVCEPTCFALQIGVRTSVAEEVDLERPVCPRTRLTNEGARALHRRSGETQGAKRTRT